MDLLAPDTVFFLVPRSARTLLRRVGEMELVPFAAFNSAAVSLAFLAVSFAKKGTPYDFVTKLQGQAIANSLTMFFFFRSGPMSPPLYSEERSPVLASCVWQRTCRCTARRTLCNYRLIEKFLS